MAKLQNVKEALEQFFLNFELHQYDSNNTKAGKLTTSFSKMIVTSLEYCDLKEALAELNAFMEDYKSSINRIGQMSRICVYDYTKTICDYCECYRKEQE